MTYGSVFPIWKISCRRSSIEYCSVFQPFQWSGTLCSNFDCSWNPRLFWGDSWGPKGQNSRPRAGRGSCGTSSEPPPHQLEGLGEQIHFGPTKSLRLLAGNVGRSLIFYEALAAEPLEIIGETLRLKNLIPVEKHWSTV